MDTEFTSPAPASTDARTEQPTTFGADSTFFKAMRSRDGIELWKRSRCAFWLLFMIATRARRTNAFNAYNLKPGEALIGDVDGDLAMSEKEYRTAKKILSELGLAAFKGTSKGTIATITNTSIFDINQEQKGDQKGGQGATEGRARGGQGATNKNDKKGKNGKMSESVGLCGERVSDFPKSEDEAKQIACELKIPTEFASKTWDKAMSRGGVDSRSIPIKDFRRYLRTEWRYDQTRVRGFNVAYKNDPPPAQATAGAPVGNVADLKHELFRITWKHHAGDKAKFRQWLVDEAIIEPYVEPDELDAQALAKAIVKAKAKL